MVWFKALGVAFAMYSKIPMPRLAFEAPERERALVFFPLVGLIQGILELLLLYLMTTVLGLPQLLAAVLWLAAHHFYSGLIHLDGYLDVSDAVASYREREERLRIMQDPHVGAFAVLHAVFYLLLEGALFYALLDFGWPKLLLLPFLYAYLRVFSGGLIYALPKAKTDGLAVLFSGERAGRYRIALAVQGVLCVLAIFFIVRCPGMLSYSVAVILMHYFYKDWAKRTFGGVTGDLAGHWLMLLELISYAFLFFFYR